MIELKPGLAIIRAYLPSAQCVNLVGAFNHWSTAATPMAAAGHGVWEIRLPLSSSEVRGLFMFVWDKGGRLGHIVADQVEIAASFSPPAPATARDPLPPIAAPLRQRIPQSSSEVG